MSEKSAPEKYSNYLEEYIFPFVDFEKLQKSYGTDMVYAKGLLHCLHEHMIEFYGGERMDEKNSLRGMVYIPAVLRGDISGNVCLAMLTLDLIAKGEHWETSYLCGKGIMTDDYIPFEYCYTADIPGDYRIDKEKLPDEIKSVLDDFKNHSFELLPKNSKD